MKVVCIDNYLVIGVSNVYNIQPDMASSSDEIDKIQLTVGKIYDTSASKNRPAGYSICCDDGISRKFHKSRFITLEEWRERKLNELGV